MALWTFNSLSRQPVIDIHTIMHIIIIDMYFYSEVNIAHTDSSEFSYKVDLCSGVSCNDDHKNECVSDLIIILYS